jgi:alkanesulfonate monooxygenase SsuD/methylene tetrahydromethanopterin reductase-like flavin-dependent oxidoreductase (luciferase family)
MFEYADSARRHYRVDEPDAFGPGYEHYRARAQSISQSVDGGQDRQTATANLLRSAAVIGTPDDCLQQLEDIARGLALEHFIGVFQYARGIQLHQRLDRGLANQRRRTRVHAQRRSEHRRMVGGAW